MTQTDAVRDFCRSMMYAIDEYTYKNGESPKVIFAERKAFQCLQISEYFLVHNSYPEEFSWRGIQVRLIRSGDDGMKIYFSGEPITFTAIQP